MRDAKGNDVSGSVVVMVPIKMTGHRNLGKEGSRRHEWIMKRVMGIKCK